MQREYKTKRTGSAHCSEGWSPVKNESMDGYDINGEKDGWMDGWI